MPDNEAKKYKKQVESFKKATSKMEVSYGVDKDKIEDEVVEMEISQAVEPKKKKKSLIDEIEEMKANGDTKSDEYKQKILRLESIMGVDTLNPFGTNELSILEEKITTMTYGDMQSLAQRVGLNPYQSESAIKKSLVKEFEFKNRNNRRNILPSSPKQVFDPDNPKHAELLKNLGDL